MTGSRVLSINYIVMTGMFGIDKKLETLEKDGTPIKTSLVGAGAMGAGMIVQMERAPGMQVNVVCDMHVDRGIEALKNGGVPEKQIEVCDTAEKARKALDAGKRVCTSNTSIVWVLDEINTLIEATGNPEVYAEVSLSAIMSKKHVVTLNVEGDVCIGHIMKRLADNAGVVYTGIYGDEPGCVMSLYTEANALGMEVVGAGRNDMGGSKLEWNKETILKALGEAPQRKLIKNPAMFASFCDGSKTNEECTLIANAIGLRPDIRGMHGPTVAFPDFSHEVPRVLDLKKNGGILEHLGVVERIGVPRDPVIAQLWVFVIIRANTDYENINMGKATGCIGLNNRILYMPYHYLSVQAPITVAYAAVENTGVIAARQDGRAADTITMAKKDLEAGEKIDEIGGFSTTGRIECASIVREENLLPFALAEGAMMKRDVQKGGFLTYDDVELKDSNGLIVQLRRLQQRFFGDLY